MKLEKLEEVLGPFPPYRLRQALRAVFVELVGSWDEATNLPLDLRRELAAACPLEIPATVSEARDGRTAKAAFSLDGGEVIEAVLMRHRDRRNTICVSSQAGCALGCDFCLSGKGGLRRDLTAGEIVGQLLFFARCLKERAEKVTNVVFMGMGEPFLNYEAVMRAVRWINGRDALGIGAQRISISTVGIVEGIRRLVREPVRVNLAVSLHAADDRLRSRLLPVNRKYPLSEVLKAVAGYIEATRRRVMIEYVMLREINDSPVDAGKLASLLQENIGRLFFVNLITYNPTGAYRPSTSGRVRRFREILEGEGITVVQRYRFGRDIKAACGQLAEK